MGLWVQPCQPGTLSRQRNSCGWDLKKLWLNVSQFIFLPDERSWNWSRFLQATTQTIWPLCHGNSKKMLWLLTTDSSSATFPNNPTWKKLNNLVLILQTFRFGSMLAFRKSKADCLCSSTPFVALLTWEKFQLQKLRAQPSLHWIS